MLLQSILAQLDAELSRLHKLRKIIAGLHRAAPHMPKPQPEPISELAPVPESTAIAEASSSQVEAPAESTPAHHHVRVRRSSPRTMRSSRNTRPERHIEPTALTSAIPSGPVMVPAQQAARERDLRSRIRLAPAPAPALDETVTLDALSRDIAARWASGRSQANS